MKIGDWDIIADGSNLIFGTTGRIYTVLMTPEQLDTLLTYLKGVRDGAGGNVKARNAFKSPSPAATVDRLNDAIAKSDEDLTRPDAVVWLPEDK